MTSTELKALAKTRGVPQWKIADWLNVSENTLIRKLRYETIDKGLEKGILRAIEVLSIEENTSPVPKDITL